MLDLPKIVAVIGPTASGKTELGTFLCQQFGGEIVSTDAKQVFRGMDIGTAKEKDLPIEQHLLDILDPGDPLSVAWYQSQAYQVIDRLLDEKILPILVGGSGLYAESLLNGYVFEDGGKSTTQRPRYNSLKIGISIDRELLRARVQVRTQEWLDSGLLDEIRRLLDSRVPKEWLEGCGQEYRFFTQYLLGEISLDEAILGTNTSINQYIKRQYTWWRRHSDVNWVENKEQALALGAEFLG